MSVYRTSGPLVFYNIHRNSIKFSFLEDYHVHFNGRNQIGNEWTCDKKLSDVDVHGQINDTKHTKTFISRPFGNSLDLWLVGDFGIFFFFLGARVGRQKKVFSLRG